MKLYIKSNTSFLREYPILEKISIFMDVDITEYIQSADLIGEGILNDTQVIADWNSFLTTVRTYISTHNKLELVFDKEGKSLRQAPEVPGSYYYYVAVKDKEGKISGTVVIDFRLSTHQSTDISGKDASKHESNILRIIQKTYPTINTIGHKDIIVNKKTFKNYDIALFAVIGIMDSIINKYG